MKRILIIKLGHSETLDPEIGSIPSLGDVMRTTVILHCFKDCHVTWLTDQSAYLLLKDNSYISKIIFYGLSAVLQLQAQRFDVVVNLEKDPGICALADTINAWSKYGFRFDPDDGVVKSYEGSHHALKIYSDINSKRQATRTWQDVLFEMLGRKWDGEKYILGYNPKSKETQQIGFNYLVGKKWPNKVWPKDKWVSLHETLESKGFSVSRQKGKTNLEDYLEWINSCQLLVTHDSLGLHIAIALRKKVVALFGPTAAHETFLYGLGHSVVPEGEYDCVPCLKTQCVRDVDCMSTLSVEKVYKAVRDVLDR